MSVFNSEILQIADSVAREKSISRDAVIKAMEHAIEIAGRRKYGHEHVIHAEINRKTGEIKLFRERLIVENVEDSFTQISLEDALTHEYQEEGIEKALGGRVLDPLPPIDLGRVAAQSAKQVIIQKVREAERERQYNDFVGRVGEIVNGVIKRIEYGDVTLDIGNAEAVLKRDSQIKNEIFKQNDRLRVYIEKVVRENKGPQIYLSRSHNQFLAKLFEQEVPEIYDHQIQIKSVAREPGSRAKIAVHSPDPSIDAVGSCVGVRGSRVQAVINELNGEKIDIIEWSSDPATFVVNALAPAEVAKVVIDEERHRIEVVVANDNLSIAIGRKGQNVRLASQLTSWNIDVLTEDEESKRRIDEFNNISKLLITSLDVEEVLANLLAAEGFTSVEEIAYVSDNDLLQIEGFNEELVEALKQRAKNYLDKEDEQFSSKLTKLGVDDSLKQKLGISSKLMLKLAENGIKALEDLADLTINEFSKIAANELSEEEMQNLIDLAKEE